MRSMVPSIPSTSVSESSSRSFASHSANPLTCVCPPVNARSCPTSIILLNPSRTASEKASVATDPPVSNFPSFVPVCSSIVRPNISDPYPSAKKTRLRFFLTIIGSENPATTNGSSFSRSSVNNSGFFPGSMLIAISGRISSRSSAFSAESTPMRNACPFARLSIRIFLSSDGPADTIIAGTSVSRCSPKYVCIPSTDAPSRSAGRFCIRLSAICAPRSSSVFLLKTSFFIKRIISSTYIRHFSE